MWHNTNEKPKKNGDYPAIIHPTFQREEGVDLGNFEETLNFFEGSWFKNFQPLTRFEWELVAWYEVPPYDKTTI